MAELILAFDLGTGGCKASLWSESAECVADYVANYNTLHPEAGRQEERPGDWWRAVIESTRALSGSLEGHRIAGISLSGQSLGVVMLDSALERIGDTTPIWSDSRAGAETRDFFTRVSEDE